MEILISEDWEREKEKKSKSEPEDVKLTDKKFSIDYKSHLVRIFILFNSFNSLSVKSRFNFLQSIEVRI